jgi:serine/threonine protein kinase
MSDPITRLNAALEGRYRIERQLGEGGMATVYLADDLKHERKVALKVLKPELAAVVGADRFLAEIKTTANLQHPHILPLFDSGEADSFLFYVMPYVEGESLRERLDREQQLPVQEAVAITTKVAGALQAAHEQGVIHRDIKPANILLSKGEPAGWPGLIIVSPHRARRVHADEFAHDGLLEGRWIELRERPSPLVVCDGHTTKRPNVRYRLHDVDACVSNVSFSPARSSRLLSSGSLRSLTRVHSRNAGRLKRELAGSPWRTPRTRSQPRLR